MSIEVDPGIYTCRLMKYDDGRPGIGLDEHHEWDAERRCPGKGKGGCQVMFGAEAFRQDESGQVVYAGRIILDLFGYTIVNPNDAKTNPGGVIGWKVDLLAKAFGIAPDKVFELDSLGESLMEAQFDVEVREYTTRSGKTAKSVNRIGPVGGLAERAFSAPSATGGTKALFAKFAANVRATHSTPGAAPAPAASPVPAPLPSRSATPASSALPARGEAPKAPAKKVWTGTMLWQAWVAEKGDDRAGFFAALDGALGREGVELSDLTPDDAHRAACEMGFDMPF